MSGGEERSEGDNRVHGVHILQGDTKTVPRLCMGSHPYYLQGITKPVIGI